MPAGRTYNTYVQYSRGMSSIDHGMMRTESFTNNKTMMVRKNINTSTCITHRSKQTFAGFLIEPVLYLPGIVSSKEQQRYSIIQYLRTVPSKMMTTENPKSSSSSEEGRARDDPPLPRAHYNFTNFLDINQKS